MAVRAEGDYGQGGVFELTPSLGYWTKTVLYSFTGGDDGGNPGAVLLGSDGNLYGRAAGGGAYGAGVLYQLAHSQGGWTENTLLALPHSQSWIPEFPNLVSDGTGNTFYFVTSDYRTGQYGWYIDAVISEMTQVDGSWSFAQVGYLPQRGIVMCSFTI